MDKNVDLVMASIPPPLEKILGVKTKGKAAAVTRAFWRSDQQLSRGLRNVEEELEHKALLLEYAKKKKKKEKRRSRKAIGLNASQRRQMKIFQIKPEHQRYELFLPLHQLWRQYIIDLCHGLKPETNPQLIQQRLLKADFHGAIITVSRSKCPSYVGTTGILVQEFKHVFKIITMEDRLKVIPKRNSVFSVEINGFVSYIYGSKFEQRSSERSVKRFKVKGTIDL